MPKVEIRTTRVNYDWNMCEDVHIFVDGVEVAEGTFGGEPEDNSRFRDYSWVDEAIEAVAKALGADVEFTDITEQGESE